MPGIGIGVGLPYYAGLGEAPWNPMSLTPQANLWHEATQGDIVLDGDGVNAWPNLGAGGTEFTQITAARQPTYTTLNGHESVLFVRANNDVLAHRQNKPVQRYLHDGTGGTVCLVINLTSTGDLRGIFATGTAGPTSIGLVLMDAGSNRLRLYLQNGSGTSIASGPTAPNVTVTGTSHVVTFRYSESESPEWDLRVDGVSVNSGNTVGAPSPLDATYKLVIGNIAGGGLGFDGHIPYVFSGAKFYTGAELDLIEAHAARLK